MGPAATAIPFADLVEFPDEALLPPLDRSNVDETTLSADQLAWRRRGVVIKHDFLPDTLLNPYIARRAAYRRPGTADNLLGWPFGFAYMIVLEMRDVALYPPLMDLLRDLVREEMVFHLALTRWDATGRQWHQDDIHTDSRPFDYVPGSHRWGLMRGNVVRARLTDEERTRVDEMTGWNEAPKYAERIVTHSIESEIAARGIPIVPFIARKGGLSIWQGPLIHRGSPARRAMPRRSLVTHCSGITHRPNILKIVYDSDGAPYAAFDLPRRSRRWTRRELRPASRRTRTRAIFRKAATLP